MKILITGSSFGIGNHLANHFAAGGHEVWGIARSPLEKYQSRPGADGGSFCATQADIARWPEMEEARLEMERAWGSLDAIICCAGIQGPIGPAMTLDPAEWAASVQVNLAGTFNTLRAFQPLLLRHTAPRAKVVCFSGGGSTGPRINFTPYAAAKAGVVRLVETLAHEWAALPVDINAIAPGAINTRMTDEVIRLGPAVAGEKEFAAATAQLRSGGAPLPRVAAMIEMLFSRAGDGITGRLLSTPWDPWETLAARRGELAASDVFTLRRVVPGDRGKDWQ